MTTVNDHSGRVLTGLDLISTSEANKASFQFKGNIGILCHSASVNSKCENILEIFKKIYPKQLKKVFGPQHGFVSDVQDNMIETKHFHHPYFDIPIYSLYSETRKPTEEMLSGLNMVVVDLQDVGTRIYTYIYTLLYMMRECSKVGICVTIIDRPNPVNGQIIEGNILKPNFKSFVGELEIPVRHGLTIGEMATWIKVKENLDLDLNVISMKNYKRSMFFSDTKLPYINPSPNLPRFSSCLNFPGSVLLEGTNLSEGRGTTRPLEVIGHPDFEPFSNLNHVRSYLKNAINNEKEFAAFTLRPTNFYPMFQKHEKSSCGGYFVHINNSEDFRPWRLYQLLIKFFKESLGEKFQWKRPGYEYDYTNYPMDLINGGNEIREAMENQNNHEFGEFLEDMITRFGDKNSLENTFLQESKSHHLY